MRLQLAGCSTPFAPADEARSIELSERKASIRPHSCKCEPPISLRWCARTTAVPLIMDSGGRYSAMGGGVPPASEGEVVAGVGVSGGTKEQAGATRKGFRRIRPPGHGMPALKSKSLFSYSFRTLFVPPTKKHRAFPLSACVAYRIW